MTEKISNKIQQLMKDADENVSYYNSVTNYVISSYSDSLDDLMKKIYSEVISVSDPSIYVMEKYFLELSNAIYFMCSKLEQLGAYAYVSNSTYKEAYNRAYLDNQVSASESKDKKKTVSELTALSEESAKTEAITSDIYSRAYKVIKMKIDAAQTMVSSLSKVISRRQSEMFIADKTPSGKQYLTD